MGGGGWSAGGFRTLADRHDPVGLVYPCNALTNHPRINHEPSTEAFAVEWRFKISFDSTSNLSERSMKAKGSRREELYPAISVFRFAK